MTQQEKDELWFLSNEQSVTGLTDKQSKRLITLEKKKKALYNGYKNYATWNVALWISNDEGLYNAARDFMFAYKGRKPYRDFISTFVDIIEIDFWGSKTTKTPDGINWLSSTLDYCDLNAMMWDLIK